MNVFICSRYAADNDEDKKRNITIAKDLVRIALDRDFVPFAPHLFFPEYLNDDDPQARSKGLRCGFSFLNWCSMVWMHVSNGISGGMSEENKQMAHKKIPIAIVESDLIIGGGIKYTIHSRCPAYSVSVKDGVIINGFVEAT